MRFKPTDKRGQASAMKLLLGQFTAFAGVGVIATSVHYALLVALVELAGLSAVTGALVGFCAGGLVSYVLNRRHTFHSERPHAEATWRFAVVVAVSFFLTYVFMTVFVSIAGIPYLLAQVATTGIVMMWGFAAHRAWTFA
jgi:putative flippase GtrA